MITINKNSVNDNVVVTVTEFTTINSPYYLFEFKRDSTEVPYYCIADNQGTETQRYDQFTITETDTPTFTDGEISLPAGDYTYTIYQQASSTNLDPAQSHGRVEIGKCQVIGTVLEPTQYPGGDLTNTSYEG